jgi:prolipoprotein diacylglyceryltransferase
MPVLWYTLATAISLSCITTGMHSVLDVLGGLLIFRLVALRAALWKHLLTVSQWFADSWREWRFGKLRLINHGFYAGIGSFIGFLLAVHLAGNEQFGYVVAICFGALIGAGIWGHVLEGSSKRARPFGFYGGLFGGAVTLMAMAWIGGDGLRLAAAFSVTAPFVQAIGRLRCLVQGCCHGRECSADNGIAVFRERSQVHTMAGLKDRYIYPTQLYSIISNFILGLILLRFWTLSIQAPFLVGFYLIISSISRFVEEAYRDEPQTPIGGGLAVYQWPALGCFVAGAIVMTVPGVPVPKISVSIGWPVLGWATILGATVCCAMGVDFPESDKRFSRLT